MSRAIRVPMRRLTPDEWLSTVRATFGANVPDLRADLPQPASVAPYSTYPEALRVDAGPAQALLEVAEAVGEALAPSLTQCGDSDFATCARGAIDEWARVAFRRTPEPADVDALQGLALSARQDGLPPNEALAVAAIGLLQHPSFLYLADSRSGEASWQLDSFERAQRLAYTLWRSPTDTALAASADANELISSTGMQAAIQHTLADPQTRLGFRQFVREWLGLATLPDSIEPNLLGALEHEFNLLVDAMMVSPNAMAAVFEGDLGYANSILEDFYGLQKSSSGPSDFRQVHVPGRSGLLTHPLVMAKAAHGETSSVILRGKLVRLNLLCGALGSPPAGARDLEPLGSSATPRERYAARAQMAQCAGCHSLMDPIGFAFEAFDGLGRYRTAINGQPVDDAAEVTATAVTNGTVHGAAELGKLLSTSEEVSICFVRQWFRYAYGRNETDNSLACSIQDVANTFQQSGKATSGLLDAFVNHASFTQRGDNQ